jgi:hypothetical protein
MVDHLKIIKWLGCLFLLCILSSTTAFSEDTCSTCNNANSATAADTTHQEIAENQAAIGERTQDENDEQTSISLSNNDNLSQIANITSNGETLEYIFTDKKIKEIFAEQDTNEDLGYEESNEDLDLKKPDREYRYAIEVNSKVNNKIKWKYSECDISTLPTIHIIMDIACPPYVSHMEGSGLISMEVRSDCSPFGPYDVSITRDEGLPSESTLSYVKKDTKNLEITVKWYRYHLGQRCPLERRHHDRSRECCGSHQDEGYNLEVEE